MLIGWCPRHVWPEIKYEEKRNGNHRIALGKHSEEYKSLIRAGSPLAAERNEGRIIAIPDAKEGSVDRERFFTSRTTIRLVWTEKKDQSNTKIYPVIS